ncbi:hybrid sensor histidine kinase/response regulator [Thiobacillus denitrificans]|uniref:hybrid sensor histidine kinase/response regulator n=1 Tax=Thiobacillus denitrificans TaxID=36861 RepID=UPI000371B4BF|nr:hybrid sensor histidine kinase/response regulator [Thiobacillus denitrificans]
MNIDSEKHSSRVKALVARVKNRPDTEVQQSIIRVAMGMAVWIYFLSGWLSHDPQAIKIFPYLAVVSLAVSIPLLVFASLDPDVSVPRRVLGMVHDFAVITFVVAVVGPAGIIIVGLYLWVTLGNGFRYGMPYLLLSTIASVVGFTVVHEVNPYWNSQPYLWWGLLFMLVSAPAYSSVLLRQLHGSIEREKEASAAKSKFLANMSHELRTPLNGVIGVTDLLAETELDRNQKHLADIAQESARALLELIDNILDISAIEAGRIVFTEEEFDLHYLVNSVASIMRPLAKNKGIELNVFVAPNVPFKLRGDDRRLRQILINLLGNAVKFTDRGWVDLNVSFHSSPEKSLFLFTVSDTGVGIEKEALDRIFEPFTQADSSITRRFGGTGLGITIVKNLVEKMGGSIRVTSTVGQGTTFHFDLPFQVSDSTDTSLGFPARIAISSGTERVDAMAKMLRELGGDVVVLDCAKKLTAKCLLDAKADIIFVEEDALSGNASTIMQHLQESTTSSLPHVVLLGSNTSASSDNTLIHSGFASVLRGGITKSLLINILHSAVAQRKNANVASLSERFKAESGGAGPLCILVAEDNPVNRTVLCEQLERMGHFVCIATNGEQALNQLQVEHCDLAIIDMHMPELAGPDVVKRWRFMEDGRMPIIMLTGDARPEARQACLDAGADDFLTKPLNSSDLVAKLAKLAQTAEQKVVSALSARASCQSHRILDPSVLNNVAEMTGVDFLPEVIAVFREQSQASLKEVRRAFFSHDQIRWQQQLHMLKGCAYDIGAWKLGDLCVNAEYIPLHNDHEKIAAAKMEEIRAAIDEAQTAVDDYMRSAMGGARCN